LELVGVAIDTIRSRASSPAVELGVDTVTVARPVRGWVAHRFCFSIYPWVPALLLVGVASIVVLRSGHGTIFLEGCPQDVRRKLANIVVVVGATEGGPVGGGNDGGKENGGSSEGFHFIFCGLVWFDLFASSNV